MHAHTRYRIDELMNAPREVPSQRSRGRTRSLFGTGLDQIGNRFGLGEIEATIQERAFGELTWARKTATQRQTAPQNGLQALRTAVALQFKN
jgi:hypothetical protein